MSREVNETARIKHFVIFLLIVGIFVLGVVACEKKTIRGKTNISTRVVKIIR